MELLNCDIELDRFFQSLREAERSLLFLDYDGTLAPFREKRDEAVPYPQVVGLLESLASIERLRVVYVTGRAIRDLQPLLGPAGTSVEIWGSHGRERHHRDGRYETLGLTAAAEEALEAAFNWASGQQLDRHSERKVGCAALHYRSMDPVERGKVFPLARAVWAELAAGAGLELHEFDGGIEIKTPGRSKGDAVAAVLSEEPPDVVAAYLGDDLTDEDAFLALEDRGLKVLVRPQKRETAADLWIRPPDELIEFLVRWRDCAVHPG